MTCQPVSKEQYKALVESPFSGFDSVEFAELNAHKVDEVKYFIFGDKANHFALVAGAKDNVLKCPFSATFGIFSEVRANLGLMSKSKGKVLYKALLKMIRENPLKVG